MRVVDGFTGREVRVGDTLSDPHGRSWRLMSVEDFGLFDALAHIEIEGRDQVVRLQVRLLHPKFLFQRVGFVPT